MYVLPTVFPSMSLDNIELRVESDSGSASCQDSTQNSHGIETCRNRVRICEIGTGTSWWWRRGISRAHHGSSR